MKEPSSNLPHSDKWDLTLKLEEEEAMCLDEKLDTGARTARVHVTVSFVDDNGANWYAERIVKMRLRKERPA